MTEPTDETALDEKVRRQLLKTGFPLELTVAEEARRHGPLYVDQSRFYVDASTNKVRETDVVACWFHSGTGVHHRYLFLVIECKSKPGPWVIFDGGGGVTDDARLRIDLAVSKSYPEGLDLSQNIAAGYEVGRSLFGESRIGTSIIEVKFGSEPDDRDKAWNAVQSAVSAAHGLLKEDIDSQGPNAGWSWKTLGVLAVPVVVTDGALFRAYLSGDGLAVEEIERGEVLVRPSIEPQETRCFVVKLRALTQLFEEASRTAQLL